MEPLLLTNQTPQNPIENAGIPVQYSQITLQPVTENQYQTLQDASQSNGSFASPGHLFESPDEVLKFGTIAPDFSQTIEISSEDSRYSPEDLLLVLLNN